MFILALAFVGSLAAVCVVGDNDNEGTWNDW